MNWSRRSFFKSVSALVAWRALPAFSESSIPSLNAAPGAFGLEAPGAGLQTGSRVTTRKVPLIHCTDLFHPPEDPDDTVDLATVFAIPRFDLRAIILDQGLMQSVSPGRIPVEQMMALTGRRVPYAAGLGTGLRYPEDTGSNQFPNFQAGVELILQVLQESKEKVFFTIAGSVRDVVAAYNREPELFHAKAARLYVNAGNSAGGDFQWNPLIDPQAYIRLMTSDLPVCWCPSFGRGATINKLAAGTLGTEQFQVYWNFRQSEIFSALPAPLQNYFLYALGRKDPAVVDPIAYLGRTPERELQERQWRETRNMWSTASIYDAAGLELWRKGDEWAALREPTTGFQPAKTYDFIPANVTIDRNLRTRLSFSGAAKPFRVFHLLDMKNYQASMQNSLRRLLSEMPLVAAEKKP